MYNKNYLKNVLIFGATGMVGSLVAQEISKYNVNLILQGKTKKKLETLHDLIVKKKINVSLLELDLLNKQYINNLHATILQRFERIDFFINAVGFIEKICPLTDLKNEEWDQLIEINLSSNWRLVKELEPLLKQSKNPKIIFFNNKDAVNGSPYYNAYAVSKSALKTMINLYNEEKKKFKYEIKMIYLPKSRSGVYRRIYSKNQISQKAINMIKENIKSLFED